MMASSEIRRYTLDLRGVQSVADIHAAARAAFDFPDYYGCNWDAMWDCLCELGRGPKEVEILGYREAAAALGTDIVPFLILLGEFRQRRGANFFYR